MKKILWLLLVLLFSALFMQAWGQTYEARVEYERPVLSKKTFNDLSEKEQYLLLSKVEEAYLAFNGKKVDTNILLVYMQENNPVVEWTGLHVEIDKKMIRYYTIERTHILKIFDL